MYTGHFKPPRSGANQTHEEKRREKRSFSDLNLRDRVMASDTKAIEREDSSSKIGSHEL